MTTFSHVQCVFTNPGYIPKNYSNIVESNLPKHFFEIMDERENISRSNSVKKALRRIYEDDQLKTIEKIATT